MKVKALKKRKRKMKFEGDVITVEVDEVNYNRSTGVSGAPSRAHKGVWEMGVMPLATLP